jgi:septal ring factor EnvC (AmiA/AmiB activator)
MFLHDGRKALAVAVAILCAAGGAGRAWGQQGDLDERLKAKDAELQKLRQEIADHRKKIEEVEKKEKDIAAYIAKLDKDERLTRKLLAGISEKEGMLAEQVQALRSDLDYNEKVYDRRRAILAKRLREMYMDGAHCQWQELLGASDFADLLQRYKFLSTIAEHDASLVEEVRERKTGIARREASITEALAQVTAARREKERELARLNANEKKRKSMLAELKTSKGKYQKRIEQLARAEQELQAIIEELEKERTRAAPEAWEATAEKDFAALKGRMQPPVAGTLVRGFGESKHPEFGTVTFNSGVDFNARTGSPIRAVARGKVDFANRVAGVGNCIVIAHGQGYYTVYMHASKILVKQGSMVSSGDVIAEAGAGTDGSSPFHFEIRKSKKALNPADWLKK